MAGRSGPSGVGHAVVLPLVGRDDAGDRLRETLQLLGNHGCNLLRAELGVVLARKLLGLGQEVPQVVFEGRVP